MKRKKLLVLLTVGMLAIGMTACGGDDGSTGNDGQNESQSTQQTSDSQSQGDEESDAPSQDNTDDGNGTDESTEDGSAGGEEGPGFDISNGWSEELEAVKQAVVEKLGDDYWPNMPMDPDIIEMLYGLTSDMYDDYLAEGPMISTNVDRLIIVKAKDGKLETVEETLKAYRDGQVNNTMQYPQNVGKIQASRVETIGNYVCYVQLGGSAIDADSAEDTLKKCQEQNALVVDILNEKLK